MSRVLPIALLLLGAAPCAAQKASVAPVASLATWRATLQGKDEPAKERALEEIRELGPAAEPLLPDLIRLFDSIFALDAVEVVGKIGKPAVGPLTACLTDPGEDTRAMAVIALGEIGPPAESTIPKLQTLAGDPSCSLRAVSLEALGKIVRRPGGVRTTLPILANALDDPEPSVVIAAHGALGRLGLLGQRRRRAWERSALVKTRPLEVRCVAAALAARTGRHADPAVREGLVDALRTPSLERSVRREVLTSLKRNGAQARWALPFLLDALSGRDPIVRGHVADVLSEVGPGSRLEREVAQALAKALTDRGSTVRRNAAYALIRYPKHITSAVATRLRWLATNDVFSSVQDAAKAALKAVEQR